MILETPLSSSSSRECGRRGRHFPSPERAFRASDGWQRWRRSGSGSAARLLLFAALMPAILAAQPVTHPLWPAGAPASAESPSAPEVEWRGTDGVRRVTRVSEPTMTIYRPETGNGTAVLVCPGGGYRHLSIDREGTLVCEWLASLGVTSVLLKYRVPTRDHSEPSRAPMQDAQRALGMLRHRATELAIDPTRVGILGFSAGGHLAIVTALHADTRIHAPDSAIGFGVAPPNFVIAIYPGFLVDLDNPHKLRPEYTVTDRAPPIYLIHAHDDDNVLSTSSGSALLYLEYKKHRRPAELHIYQQGGHGFGISRRGIPIDRWTVQVEEWMRSTGWLAPRPAKPASTDRAGRDGSSAAGR
jgi:acetyl esterase/lipase